MSSVTVSQRSVPAPFLMKTYQLVDDERTDDVVSWNEDGTTFVVWKTAEFAKDLLPNYFKHNNFSSFVRQLNTYGFRKTVPDKWEFANENFIQGQKQLLTMIRRRKTTTSSTPATGKHGVGGPSSSQVNSGDDIVSGSTSSPETSATNAQFADLTDQNEKLKREKETLSSELANAKKQCDDLVNLLTCHFKVSPEEVNRILSERVDKGDVGDDGGGDGNCCRHNYDRDDNDNDDDENGESLRLFGVTLKDKKRKRTPEENNDIAEDHAREIKNVGESTDFIRFPWMKMVGC